MPRNRELESSLAVLDEPESQDERAESKVLCRFEGKVKSWRSNEHGVVIESDSRLLLNGQEDLLPPDVKFDEWFLTPEGIILRQGRDFSVKRFGSQWVDPLYKNEGQYRGSYEFSGGVCIRDDNRFLINGTEEVQISSGYKRAEYHPRGVITESGHHLVLHKPDNRSNLLYEGNLDPERKSWRANPWIEGVIVKDEKENKLYLHTDTHKNPEFICEDNLWSWEPCQNGVVGYKDDGLHFYGPSGRHELLYNGHCDFQVRAEGVALKVDNEWHLITIK